MSIKQGGNTIASGVTVDQTYDGTSTNAQSGTAVAGAIADMVTTTNEVQSIANTKTFAEKLSISKDSQHCEVVMNSDVAKGSNPTATEYFEALAQDNDTSTVSASHRLGDVYTSRDTAGLVRTAIRAWQNVANSTTSKEIGVSIASDGTVTTNAPAVTNTNGIVTQTALTKAMNGYLKLGNGIIVQWGDHSTTSAGASTITFPTAFTDNNYSIVATRVSGTSTTNDSGSYYFRGRTTTGVGVYKTSNNTQAMMWLAVGY